jgi:hypothetical protein
MRRGFGRPLRRAFAPDVPPLLRRANQALSAGNFVEAANSYEQLARAAEARGGPRAPLFYIQAGRCKLLAGRTVDGLEYLERGLGLLAARAQQAKATRLGQRILRDLNARGLKPEAERITAYLDEIIPGFSASPGALNPIAHPALPAHCPGCGAPLRPDEVEWLDDSTAACDYCGSPVRGNQ